LIFFHGRHGRSVARKFNLSLSAAVKGIDVDQEPEAYVHALKSVYHSLINDSNGLLDGAYNNHSFKTYLLAFNKFITPWNGDTDLSNPDVADYLNRVNIDVDDK